MVNLLEINGYVSNEFRETVLNNDTVDSFNIKATLQSALTMELVIGLTFKATKHTRYFI